MQKVNGWQTTDTKWWEKLIWALGPGELKTFLRTIKWTLLPSLNTIGPMVLGKRFKCKSLRTMRRDGHQVMIIPLITLKGLIFIQAHPYKYMKNATQTKVCRPARCITFFSAVDLIQLIYLDILYNYIYNKVNYDKSAIYTPWYT